MAFSALGVTRLLVIACALVLHRWLELWTGWPEYVVLPIAAVGGTVGYELLALPASCRLSTAGWIANAGAACLLAVGIYLVSR